MVNIVITIAFLFQADDTRAQTNVLKGAAYRLNPSEGGKGV